MTTRRKATRRDELLEAALRCFGMAGVAGTSIDDIVREAGAAKGTFYLYFASRDEIITAVAERLVERVGSEMDRSLRDRSQSPSDRLRGVPAAMSLVTHDGAELALVAEIHRPENRSIHDRLGGAVIARLLPTVASVVEEGIADGSFPEQDPRRAAAFVLGALSAVDELVRDPADLEPTIRDVQAFVLRGLGYQEPER